ncbi:uncharacterized protein il12rb1 isoform X2 [Antennarius striatus]|uniref:uncharacterized protein il12rb1 isoform X2 n=1 Tax=Antennarius striatus TaxID=241820 RepID=UPI0035B3D360
METFKLWHSLHGYIVVFTFFKAFRTGSSCEYPTSPQCFRRSSYETSYICEWSTSMVDRNVTYDLYMSDIKCKSIKETSCELQEEQLFVHKKIPIWVEAHVGNSSCTSTKRFVVLKHTVKYDAPQNITMSWLKNNLTLSWTAAEEYPALAEVGLQRYENPREFWENRTMNTTNDGLNYQMIIVNLLKDTAYQVQIRHRSNRAHTPLWSTWSHVIVPAELEQKLIVSTTTRLLNGTRKVTLRWKPAPHAAAVTEVMYSLKDTQSSHGCPCNKAESHTKENEYTTYISYSAANITIIARNAAGYSTPAIVPIQAEAVAGLERCDKTLLDEKLKKTTCLEFHEVQDTGLRTENVITLMGRKKKKERQKMRKAVKVFTRYLYSEHNCNGGKPQTVKKCLFYLKEGVPLSAPRDFIAFGETYNSVNLSWKAIPTEEQQGFHTHYSLCSVKVSPVQDLKKCYNLSTSLLNHHLENLTSGAKYNISLAAVTRVGEGPRATEIVNTPQKSLNVLLFILSFMFVLFLISTTCTWILRRIKTKVFPPVPKPVIPNLNHVIPESEDALEKKEEVDKLTLHQLLEHSSAPEDAEETTVFGGEWDGGTNEDLYNQRGDARMSKGTSDEHLSHGYTHNILRNSREGAVTDLEEVENEITMMIYRNGLVFDVRPDST